MDHRFNELCGFTEREVAEVVQKLESQMEGKTGKAKEALGMMQQYYNGYCFAYDNEPKVYNPTLSLYFFREWQTHKQFPPDMLDANLAMDGGKLDFIAKIEAGRQLVLDLTQNQTPIEISNLDKRFGIKQLLQAQSHNIAFMASALYYFGILTLAGISRRGKLMLEIPNQVMLRLYVERLHQILLPDTAQQDQGKVATDAIQERSLSR